MCMYVYNMYYTICIIQNVVTYVCMYCKFSMYMCQCVTVSPHCPAQLVPQWVAPNLITFTGWLMVISDFVLLSYYDYDYYASFNDKGIQHPPIPRWVWLYCAITHFTAYTLDGIDGKQARRTKSSTPLGVCVVCVCVCVCVLCVCVCVCVVCVCVVCVCARVSGYTYTSYMSTVHTYVCLLVPIMCVCTYFMVVSCLD